MTYSKEQLDQIFAKGKEIPGKDPARYRKDACGNEIYRQSYGKENLIPNWGIFTLNQKTINHLLLQKQETPNCLSLASFESYPQKN